MIPRTTANNLVARKVGRIIHVVASYGEADTIGFLDRELARPEIIALVENE